MVKIGELHERHSWRKERTKESVFHKINKEKEITKPSKLFFIIPLVLILMVGLPYTVYIHSIPQSVKACIPTDFEISHGLPCGDPSTQIFISNDYNDYNTFLTSSSTGIVMNPNSTHTSVALSKSPIGDIGVATGKQLGISADWTYSSGSCCGNSIAWGFYLTTNSTLPTEPGYDPEYDKSVSLLFRVLGSGGVFYHVLFLQKKAGDALITGDYGNCNQAGTVFLCEQDSIAQTNLLLESMTLNFTGGSTTTLSGKSGITTQTEPSPPGSISSTTTVTIPWLQISSVNYYWGYYALKGLPFSPKWDFRGCGGSYSACSYIYMFTPNPPTTLPASTTDSGNFFGSIGRFVGGAWNTVSGVVGSAVGSVIGPILNLGGGLLNVFISALTQALGLFVQQLRLFLNIVGGWFGIGNVGDSIINFFIGIGSFFVSVIGGGFSILDELATEGNKIITAIINFFTNGLSIFNFINDFLNSMSGLWSIIVGGWNEFLHWYTIGSMSISYFLVLWYFFGIYQVYLDGIHGLKSWLDMSEMFLLSIFKAGYWFSKESFSIVLTIKQLVAGWV